MRAVGFDMDGVLFGTSTYKSVKVIGLKALLRFMFHSHSFPKREVFFESLRKLHFDTGGMSVVHQGVELPAILTAWQCGLVSGPDAEALIAKFYEEQNDWHASEVRVFRVCFFFFFFFFLSFFLSFFCDLCRLLSFFSFSF